MGGIVNPKS